jgi:CheY-like chemotaxis protein
VGVNDSRGGTANTAGGREPAELSRRKVEIISASVRWFRMGHGGNDFDFTSRPPAYLRRRQPSLPAEVRHITAKDKRPSGREYSDTVSFIEQTAGKILDLLREKAAVQDQKTILVVDDDPQIISLVSAVLADSKYQVLTAANGAKALQQSREYPGEIHLLLSDFQMPGMSGIDLGTVMTAERPNLKVLMMSGFDGGMLVLNEGWHFLAKPFIASQLRALILGLVYPDRTNAKFSKVAGISS